MSTVIARLKAVERLPFEMSSDVLRFHVATSDHQLVIPYYLHPHASSTTASFAVTRACASCTTFSAHTYTFRLHYCTANSSHGNELNARIAISSVSSTEALFPISINGAAMTRIHRHPWRTYLDTTGTPYIRNVLHEMDAAI